jgi:hypoxanthine phosphoribosyltransferase
MQSYDYAQRKGTQEITWEQFAGLAANLAEQLAPCGVDVVIGIARAGLFPATTVACMLRRELYPVRITRRFNDQVTYDRPVWKVDVSAEVVGKVVAVVDEITDTGETLALAVERVRERGAAKVITASLISHSWANPKPDLTALVTDALVIFPWDKNVFEDGKWHFNSDLEEALKLQRK